MNKNEKRLLVACLVLILVLSVFWWHKVDTWKTRYSESKRFYIAMWVSQDAALLRAFSEDALEFINSSNYTEAAVSIRHAEGVMTSLTNPLYETLLYLGDGFNESKLEMTHTDYCASFLNYSAERVIHGNEYDIRVIKEGLTEIQNFSAQILKRYPLSARASEETLRENWELQNKCRAWLKELGG